MIPLSHHLFALRALRRQPGRLRNSLLPALYSKLFTQRYMLKPVDPRLGLPLFSPAMTGISLKDRLGVGPTGILMTLLVWSGFYYGGRALDLPPMSVYPILRLLLLIMFLADAIYLVGGGIYALRTQGWGEKLITSGPFLFVRHPLYSALIYSATGSLALWQYSWSVLVAVIPLSFLWSWLVSFEEQKMIEKFGREYEDYCLTTGQFFPSLKHLDDKISRF